MDALLQDALLRVLEDVPPDALLQDALLQHEGGSDMFANPRNGDLGFTSSLAGSDMKCVCLLKRVVKKKVVVFVVLFVFTPLKIINADFSNRVASKDRSRSYAPVQIHKDLHHYVR